MKRLIALFLILFPSFLFANETTYANDSLALDSFHLVLIKENGHIINAGIKTQFNLLWTKDATYLQRYRVVGIFEKNEHFFDGISNAEIIELFGEPNMSNNGGGYDWERFGPNVLEFCWINFYYKNGVVWAMVFFCS